MPSLAEVMKANAASQLSYKPIALVVGGTSGIGKVSSSSDFSAYLTSTKNNAL